MYFNKKRYSGDAAGKSLLCRRDAGLAVNVATSTKENAGNANAKLLQMATICTGACIKKSEKLLQDHLFTKFNRRQVARARRKADTLPSALPAHPRFCIP